jgi:hypothetical protein
MSCEVLTTYRLTKRATIELPSPGIHITVRAPYIYVSTLQHSHLCFTVVETHGKYEFQRVFTDSRERSCSAHLVVDIPTTNATPNTIVLVNDKKSASITGLYHAPDRTYKNAAPTVFEACLPRTVIRIQQGAIRPPWRRPARSSNPPTGIINDDIIGACSDGTIFTFAILSEPARHMLRFLQNLIGEKQRRDPAQQDTPIHHRNGGIRDVLMNGAEGNQDEKIRALDVDPRQKERRSAGPRHKHVDGDLLQRWLDADGDVEALVGEGTEGNVSILAEEFAGQLWGGNSIDSAQLKSWLAEVFTPVL